MADDGQVFEVLQESAEQEPMEGARARSLV